MTEIETKRREEWFDFVELNWEMIAAFAWKSYQKYGRGVVYIDLDEAQPTPLEGVSLRDRDIILSNEIAYCGDGFQDDWDSDEEARFVEEYKPEEQVVITLIQDDGRDSHSRVVSGPPGPPEAYEKLMAGEHREEDWAAEPIRIESAGVSCE